MYLFKIIQVLVIKHFLKKYLGLYVIEFILFFQLISAIRHRNIIKEMEMLWFGKYPQGPIS